MEHIERQRRTITHTEGHHLRFYQPCTFKKDWKKLQLSGHVLKERLDRFKTISRDAEVIMAWKEINENTYILFLDSGDRLITTNNMIITVITKDLHLSPKNVILWEVPYTRAKEDWNLKIEEETKCS